MRNVAERIVFQSTTALLYVCNSNVNGICSDECDGCHATCTANIRTRMPIPPPFITIYNNTTQCAPGLRAGQSKPLDTQRLFWLVNFPSHS